MGRIEINHSADFSAERIRQGIAGQWLGRNLIWKETTESTNRDAALLAGEKPVHGTVIVADCQTGGKGRRGRSWTSPAGVNLYFSILMKPEMETDKISTITLVTALAVAEALREKEVDVQIKWPNDLVIHGRKLAGILTELKLLEKKKAYVITGIGINVNQTEFPEDLQENAVSLALETGRNWERSTLLCDILKRLEERYDRFFETGDLSFCLKEYEALLANRGRNVMVMEPAGAYAGVALGIDERGRLLVQREDGTVASVYAGEVSVRGIYGYV